MKSRNIHARVGTVLALVAIAASVLLTSRAEAETGLAMACSAGNAAGQPISGSACTERRYVRPSGSTLVASRPDGATCTWTGADCQWRAFSSLAPSAEVLICTADIPANAPWSSTDPCGSGNTQKAFRDASLVSVPSEGPTLTFTAQTTTGAESVVPVLTWNTVPVASSCTASGDPAWTGTKPASGTATLEPVTSSKVYTLTCTWPGDTSARLTWTAPTTNTDGSPLPRCASQTDTGACLKGFRINRGNSPTVLNTPHDVNDPNATGYTFTGLAAGTWYFNVEAFTGQGVESEPSNTAQKTISATGGSVNRTVGITVNPKPSPVLDLAVE